MFRVQLIYICMFFQFCSKWNTRVSKTKLEFISVYLFRENKFIKLIYRVCGSYRDKSKMDLPRYRVSFHKNVETIAVIMRANGENIAVKTGPLFSIAHNCNQYVNAVTITPCHLSTKWNRSVVYSKSRNAKILFVVIKELNKASNTLILERIEWYTQHAWEKVLYMAPSMSFC